ncbi:hypothetical protein D3C73_1106590 [compost metagenome]
MAPITRLPTLAMVAVWPAVKVPLTPSMVKVTTLRTLSMSLSLLSTLPIAAVSSAVTWVSAVKTLGSSTAVTVRPSVLLEPVLVVYVTCGTAPL